MNAKRDGNRSMRNPPHVGEILRELYLEPLGLSITEVADHLGVTRQGFSRIINKKSGISAEMAIRLGKAFGTSAEYWMGFEKQYELWQASQQFDASDIVPFDEAA